MQKDKSNIGTLEEPCFIEEGDMVHDMRTSLVRKVSRIIFDPNHQPDVYVFLELSRRDIDGNGRELSELREVEVEGPTYEELTMGEPDTCDYCGRAGHEPNIANCGECA